MIKIVALFNNGTYPIECLYNFKAEMLRTDWGKEYLHDTPLTCTDVSALEETFYEHCTLSTFSYFAGKDELLVYENIDDEWYGIHIKNLDEDKINICILDEELINKLILVPNIKILSLKIKFDLKEILKFYVDKKEPINGSKIHNFLHEYYEFKPNINFPFIEIIQTNETNLKVDFIKTIKDFNWDQLN